MLRKSLTAPPAHLPKIVKGGGFTSCTVHGDGWCSVISVGGADRTQPASAHVGMVCTAFSRVEGISWLGVDGRIVKCVAAGNLVQCEE